MDILTCGQIDITDHGKTGSAKIFVILVSISDVGSRAQEMVSTIVDTSWLDDLDIVSKASLEARSIRTIEKLVDGIFSKVADTVTEEFGEYLISDTAQSVLCSQLDHIRFPLADLIKEKVTGNPGFDFHTETHSSLLAFGEAKYSGSINPYKNALEQIVSFIDLKKDLAELVLLEKFASPSAMQSCLGSKKAFVAAFSINSEKPASIVSNLLKSEHIDQLLDYDEIYIVGVKVESK